MRQRGKARAAVDLGARQQRTDHRLHRRGAEDHCLFSAARVEQPVGENMAAFAIGAKLRFIERNECQIPRILVGASGVPVYPQRHRLRRAQQPAGIGRFDPLLASDQRNPVRTLDDANPVINLARQQPQRKADRARRMRAEPLDSQVRLAGIGRPEHGNQLAVLIGAGGERGGLGHRVAQCGSASAAPQAGMADFPQRCRNPPGLGED